MHDGTPLPALNDEEGAGTPLLGIEIIDAHVHLFPDKMFDAIWKWFDEHGWPIRYKLYSQQVLDFLFSRGVSHVVALHYAHKAGMARSLNRYMSEIAAREKRVTALATVMPGEDGARQILDEAFASGLRGVKIHCHVQCVAADDPRMTDVYEACVAADVPLVMHCGREPKSPAYLCDPYELCSAERVDAALRAYPRLKLCVPHLGADEFDAYLGLLEKHAGLWLDTTMMLAEYFPALPVPMERVWEHADRVLYGSDFPNLPYAWDRELKVFKRPEVPAEVLPKMLSGNARALFRIA